ncbi:kit ligand a, partial [Austrofundulus limnaeus]|uniref:Kit ligand n=1 Tax=Austrofundulus limnaeus TaxID=52670 RepID=A0A2I4BZ99_AUSLI
MKKSKSWIHVCVRFLLFITLGVHSATFEVTAVTDGCHDLPSNLKQNIPKDYKIPVFYIPKEVARMCWVKLNIYYLEQSIQDLADKFGNVSSNKQDINLVNHCLQNVRMIINDLNREMLDFECHYRREWWETEQYFNFVEELFGAANSEDFSYECDPPPCPSTPAPDSLSTESPTPSEPPVHNGHSSQTINQCDSSTCKFAIFYLKCIREKN